MTAASGSEGHGAKCSDSDSELENICTPIKRKYNNFICSTPVSKQESGSQEDIDEITWDCNSPAYRNKLNKVSKCDDTKRISELVQYLVPSTNKSPLPLSSTIINASRPAKHNQKRTPSRVRLRRRRDLLSKEFEDLMSKIKTSKDTLNKSSNSLRLDDSSTIDSQNAWSDEELFQDDSFIAKMTQIDRDDEACDNEAWSDDELFQNDSFIQRMTQAEINLGKVASEDTNLPITQSTSSSNDKTNSFDDSILDEEAIQMLEMCESQFMNKD